MATSPDDKITCPHCHEVFNRSDMCEYEGQLVCEDCGYEYENADDENEIGE